jgi:putative peptidoglycan lipid II flippase
MAASFRDPRRHTRVSARLTGSLVSGAALGKLLGFAREVEMARLLGASIVTDSFRGALTAVLLPVAPIQSDMLPSVVIPLHRTWEADGDQAPRSAALAIVLTAFAVVVAICVFIFAAPWIGVLVGKFGANEQELTVRLVHVMSLAIPPSVLATCLSSIEIATGRSRIAAVRASTQNVGVMGGIAIMAITGQPMAIAWGFVLAFYAVAGYGLMTLWREGIIAARGLRAAMPIEVSVALWRLFRPLLAVPLADQGNILLERSLASGVGIGALASLDYARTLTESAFYLVSQPIGYVVLARAAGRDHTDRADVALISRRLLAIGMPISVFVAVFAPDIVTVVFARGAFDERAVQLTTGALRGIAFGLWASTLGWVLVRLLNAAGRNGVAAAIIVSAYASNAGFNFVAVPLLGTFGLGLGEALRGLVLLAGTAAALRSAGLMFVLVGRAAGIALCLAACGIAISVAIPGPFGRLIVAIPIFGTATTLWLAVCMPDQRRWMMYWLRRQRRWRMRA